jgi:hypothetical protein
MREVGVEMTSTIFVGTTRRMSALAGALALVATLAVLLMSGASVAAAQGVNEQPSSHCAICERIEAAICTVLLRSLPVAQLPSGDPVNLLIEKCAEVGVGTVSE